MYEPSLELVRSARERTLRLCAGLTQLQSDFSPGVGKWSIGEVLDHLLLAEKLYRDIFAKLIQLQSSGRRAVIRIGFDQVNTSFRYIPKTLMSMFEVPLTLMNLFIPNQVREAMTQFRILPVRAGDVAVPQKGRPVGELRAALAASYEETAALFRANPGLDFRHMRHIHPLMGDNHVLDSLRLIALHERRHQSQIDDVLQSRRFPKVA